MRSGLPLVISRRDGGFMRIRFACLVLGVFLMPSAVLADSHFADYYGGFSGGGGGSTLYGVHQSFFKEFVKPSLRLVGVGADFSVQFGSRDNKNETQVIFMAGPRYTALAHDRHVVNVEYLIGTAFTANGLDSGNQFLPWSAGASYDVVVSGETVDVNGRKTYTGWTLRTQVNYIHRKGVEENLTRASVGLAYRFHK